MGAATTIWNPELIHYTCIARSSTILAHHGSGSNDPNMEALASECLALTPPNHSLFSHTVNHRTYTFLIDPPFVFFAIFDHRHTKSQTLAFLHRIRSSLTETLHPLKDSSSSSSPPPPLPPLSLQTQFDLILREILHLDDGSTRSPPPAVVGVPHGEGLKKKKRVVDSAAVAANGTDAKDRDLTTAAAMVDVNDDLVSLPAVVTKGVPGDHHHRHKAKHVWKKHVWVVLLLDLFVCAVLFVIWLWVCSGFKCMTY
ncbi:phytolongin Phyl2.2 [Lotus japonicus]|uniref:phytolongin Phyl2.2 n=1 Tax=Lotus japonicus TaxID=34305 RepID=UPI00258ECF81|nr:phytolongin Phyl2.2 [Lotus japonicus]